MFSQETTNASYSLPLNNRCPMDTFGPSRQRKAPCVANRVSCCSQTRRLSRSDVAMHPCSKRQLCTPQNSMAPSRYRLKGLTTASNIFTRRGGGWNIFLQEVPLRSQPPRKQGLNSNQNKGRKYKRLPGPYLRLEMILQVPPKVTKLHQRWGWFKGKLVVHPPPSFPKGSLPFRNLYKF